MVNRSKMHRSEKQRMIPNRQIGMSVCALLFFLLACAQAQYYTETNTTRVDVLREKVEITIPNMEEFSSLSPEDAAKEVVNRLVATTETRLAKLFAKTKTPECRADIAKHFSYYLNAIGLEESLPFSDIRIPNECPEEVYDVDNLPEGMHLGHIQNRTYQPPRDESEYLQDPAQLRICYGIMTHDNPQATIRLIEALHEEGHSFVVHVDAKEASQDTFQAMKEYAATRDHVLLVQDPMRVRVIWGGFSMVNATLQILRVALALDSKDRDPLSFHKFIHLSSSSYPLASNTEIRYRLADFPLDANFLNVIMVPSRPYPYVWHYFVECDDALHRIFQLPKLQRDTAGIELHTSSQWFIISREFAEYIARADPGSVVHLYLQYIEHVVVADETFFGTLLRHTKFCTKHHNRNFLHLQFDRWESEIPVENRDSRKCPMPDPNHCGRSPTTMTVDYADILELSDDLFARKFVDAIDTQVKDIIDEWRALREKKISEGVDPLHAARQKSLNFEGHGVLIVARDTVGSDVPLCLGLGPSGNQLLLTPCFEDWVPETLASDWETGAVILSETLPHNRWETAPCTSDGDLQRLPTGEINVTFGNYSGTGPRCMLKMMDGIRAGRCFDGNPEGLQPGGLAKVYPCVNQWFQFVSFGDGSRAPKGSLYVTVPSHTVKQIQNLGHEQIADLCLGVFGRGNMDEVEWNAEKDEEIDEDDTVQEGQELADLSEWENTEIHTTQCTNHGAVIEWVFVPFIEEEEEISSAPQEHNETGTTGDDGDVEVTTGTDEL